MATIQSSSEHLTLNADGAGKDIKFQANGVEKASIDSSGNFTSTSIDATKLSGALPAIDGSALTGSMGKVLQVVQAFKTDTSTLGSTSWLDIPGLLVTITPSSASSKVAVSYSVQSTMYTSAAQLRLIRDTTAVALADTFGARTPTTTGHFYQSSDQNHQNTPQSTMFLDSPASTSALTYKVQIKTQAGGTAYINRSGNDADNGDWSHRSTSHLTVMEIGA